MYKIILILIVFSFSALAKSSIILNCVTDDGDKMPELTFGIDEKATFGLDYDLGETYTLPAPPPSPFYIFGLLNFYDSTLSDQVWGTKDLIPFPTQPTKHIHNFKLWLDGGRKFTFNWQINGINVDSAKIQDEAGGQFINIDLMKSNSLYWENENVSTLNLKLVVWYNSKINSVSNVEEFSIYPNPANSIIKIDYDFQNGKIIDINGKIVKVFNDKFVNISNFNSGKYFIILQSKEKQYQSSFIVE